MTGRLTAAFVALSIALVFSAGVGQGHARPSVSDVFETHGIVSLLIDPADGRIIDANPAAADFYGHSRDRLRTMRIQDINQFTAEQVQEERELAVRENRNFFIFRHRLASGDVKTVQVHFHPYAWDGRTLLLSTIIDISGRRAAEADLWHYQNRLEEMVDAQAGEIRDQTRTTMWLLGAGLILVALAAIGLFLTTRRLKKAEAELVSGNAILAESREEYRKLVENVPAVVFRSQVDPPWTMFHISQATRLLTGHDPEAFLSGDVNWGDLIAADDLPLVERAVSEALDRDADYEIEYRIRHADGSQRWMREVGRGHDRDPATGRASGLAGVIMDVTERKQAEGALRIKEENNQKMLDAMGASGFGLLVIGGDETVQYMNQPMIEMFGDRVDGNCHIDLVGQPERCPYCRLDDVVKRGEIVHYRPTTPDGRSFDITAVPVKNDDGTVSKLEIIKDVTEQARIADERDRTAAALARSNKEIARLAEIMAHHFQEPSRRLVTFSQRLRKSAPCVASDDESLSSLDFIEKEAWRLNQLANDIQSYLAADTPRSPVRDTDPAPVIAKLVPRFAPRLNDLGGRIETGPMPPVPLDPPRLELLFNVLLENALEHAHAPGAALLIVVSAEVDGGRVRYRVEDNGPGIPDQFRERAFNLFEMLQTSGSGTGLGLAISRRIVESAGGRIWIEQSRSGGAAVVFEFTSPTDTTSRLSAKD